MNIDELTANVSAQAQRVQAEQRDVTERRAGLREAEDVLRVQTEKLQALRTELDGLLDEVAPRQDPGRSES